MPESVIVLVFGEDTNDTRAVKDLILALRSAPVRVETRRSPLVLVKGKDKARDRKNVAEIAAVVRAEQRRGRRCAVVAHRDCDAIEPAHEQIASVLEQGLLDEGIGQAVAAAAAWEIEAWWFLWPDAALAVNSKWRRPEPPNAEVGRIENAKEAFRQALRPKVKSQRPRDYVESDSPKIAAKVRELGLVDQRAASSRSFERFAALLLHPEPDGLDRIGWQHGMMLRLIRLYQGGQHVQAVAVWGAKYRIVTHQRGDLVQRCFVIGLGPDRTNIHSGHARFSKQRFSSADLSPVVGPTQQGGPR